MKDKVTNGTINPKETNNLITEDKLMTMPVSLKKVKNNNNKVKNNLKTNLKNNKNLINLKKKLNINLDFIKEVKTKLNNLKTIILTEMLKYLEMLNLLKRGKKKNFNKLKPLKKKNKKKLKKLIKKKKNKLMMDGLKLENYIFENMVFKITKIKMI